jgi:hypothetical protein
MKLLNQLWNDEDGFVVSLELILVGTILGIGLVAGLAGLRDSVSGELADVAYAIGSVNQSYAISGITGHSAASGNSSFADTADFCENGATTNAACQTIAAPAALANVAGSQTTTGN